MRFINAILYCHVPAIVILEDVVEGVGGKVGSCGRGEQTEEEMLTVYAGECLHERSVNGLLPQGWRQRALSSPFVPAYHLLVYRDSIRDWSLITGRGGGLQNGRGGAYEVLPLRKGGAQKVLAMLKRGGTISFGVVFTR